MFIYSCSFAPICLDRVKIRLLGLDECIRRLCRDCVFGGCCKSEYDVPYNVHYTSDREDLNE